jgi:membrane fusion protein (multidrug efflux system)
VFELLPPQNATGNWIKVVRRVPVRIGLRAEDIEAHPLRLGLSMAVDLDVRDTSGPLLGESPAGETSYATTVYTGEAELRDQAIEKIIRDNGGGDGTAAQGGSEHGG